MPIAKYLMQNLLAQPSVATKKVIGGTGGGWAPPGGVWDPYCLDRTDDLERVRRVAWELGGDNYIKGQPISFDEFTMRAVNSIEEKNAFRIALREIDNRRAIHSRMEIVRKAIMIGGISYIVYRILYRIALGF